MINVDTLGQKELDALINAAEARKKVLKKRAPAAIVRAKLEKVANAAGYTIQELYGLPESKPKRPATTAARKVKSRKSKPSKKVAAKYRNPANPSETWTGRGLPPKWLAAQIAAGKPKADFLIPGVAKPTPAKGRKSAKKRLVKN